MLWPAERGLVPASVRGHRLRAVVSCDAVSDELPLVVDGSRRPSPLMTEHLRSCLRCQAELAGYRRLVRALRSLRDQPVVSPAPELVSEALRALQEHLATRRRKNPWVIAGTVAAVGAAVGMAALGVRFPRRSRATA